MQFQEAEERWTFFTDCVCEGGRVPQNMQAFRQQKFTCFDGYLSHMKFIVWHFLEKPKCWIFWTKIRNLHLQDTRVCVSLCNWTIDCFKCYRKDQKGHKNFKASSTALWVPSIVGHHILNLRNSNSGEKENPNFIARISNKLGQKSMRLESPCKYGDRKTHLIDLKCRVSKH